MFDALALKREFPGLADTSLHYLDSAATADASGLSSGQRGAIFARR